MNATYHPKLAALLAAYFLHGYSSPIDNNDLLDVNAIIARYADVNTTPPELDTELANPSSFIVALAYAAYVFDKDVNAVENLEPPPVVPSPALQQYITNFVLEVGNPH